MASKKCFETTPLVHTDRSIRLLQIDGSSSGDAISCTLRRFSLSTCPEYTALSYTWGPERPMKEITVNDEQVSVRVNLWEFLKVECTRNAARLYWIDALCIDQANMLERNHQVNLMRIIYSTVRSRVDASCLFLADPPAGVPRDCLARVWLGQYLICGSYRTTDHQAGSVEIVDDPAILFKITA